MATAARGEARITPRVEVANYNAVVTALKPSEDGQACIVRVFETAGKDSDLILNWSDPKPKKIWLSDNSEKPLKEVTKIQLPANSLVTREGGVVDGGLKRSSVASPQPPSAPSPHRMEKERVG